MLLSYAYSHEDSAQFEYLITIYKMSQDAGIFPRWSERLSVGLTTVAPWAVSGLFFPLCVPVMVDLCCAKQYLEEG